MVNKNEYVLKLPHFRVYYAIYPHSCGNYHYRGEGYSLTQYS